MITSDQMKKTATEVLGRDRVMELALGPYYASRMSIGVPQALPQATDLETGNTSVGIDASEGGDGFQNDDHGQEHPSTETISR